MEMRKYGVATHFYVPIVKRGVADFAVSADWSSVAGDVKISKDGGAAANVTNLPVAITMGNTAVWDFSFTTTEMEAALVVVTVADAATKTVEDQCILIATFGHASAQYAVDFSDAVGFGLSRIDAAISSRLATGSYTAPLDAAGTRTAVGLATANLDTQLAAIAAFIDTEISAMPDSVWDEVVEGSTTARQLLRGFASALLAKASGLETTAAKYRDLANTKDRIAATVDADGNRSAVTLDLT